MRLRVEERERERERERKRERKKERKKERERRKRVVKRSAVNMKNTVRLFHFFPSCRSYEMRNLIFEL